MPKFYLYQSFTNVRDVLRYQRGLAMLRKLLNTNLAKCPYKAKVRETFYLLPLTYEYRNIHQSFYLKEKVAKTCTPLYLGIKAKRDGQKQVTTGPQS